MKAFIINFAHENVNLDKKIVDRNKEAYQWN